MIMLYCEEYAAHNKPQTRAQVVLLIAIVL